MAQTGYTPILIYSSTTASQAPAAGNLTNSTLGSELAINITDGKLFYKDNANAVQVIGWKTTPTTAGGTGLTSYTAGDLLYYASGTTLSKLAIGTSGQWLGSSGTAPQWNSPAALTKTDDTNVTLTLGGSASTALLNAASLTLGWTGQLAVTRGGTGLSSVSQGDILYGSAANTLSALAKNTTATRYLANTGTSNNPAWAQVDLTNGVTGTLPTSNGGTGLTSFTSGGVPYATSTSALTTGTALQFNGKVQGIGAAPSTWYTTYNGVQINTVGGITSNSDFFAFSDNVLVDASANDVFLTNGYATRYRQVASSGKHEWYATAASGTAGNAATLALLLDLSPSSGDLGLKTGNLVISTSGKGIAGTTTNDNANAGVVGEFVSSYVSSLVALSTGTAKDVTSISLTAGDWDVTGCIGFLPASTTSVTALAGTIFTTSATYQDNSQYSFQDYYSSIVPGSSTTFYKTLPTVRLSLASTTTVYLIAKASFSISALYHGSSFIRARRVR